MRLVHAVSLIVMVCAMASSGPLLKQLDRTPPLLKAFWRLFVHSLVMAPPAWVQLRRLQRNTPDLYARYWAADTWRVLLRSGAALSLHFACWVVSLNVTSLAHSLVLICSSPLFITLWMLLTRVKLSAQVCDSY